MNLGEQTGRMINLEPIEGAPAAIEEPLANMAPVTDPVTGEVSEHDPALVEHG